MSAASKPAFFNNGITIACFCDIGRRPCDREALISAVMISSSTSITSFNRNVSIGSSDDDLDGDAMITRRTLASVTSWKTSIDMTADVRT